MNLLEAIKKRFATALAEMVDDPTDLLDMIRPTQDPKFGDYQANCAMPLKAVLGKPPRDIAAEIVSRLELEDLCEPPEIAGPGFINLRVRDDWIRDRIQMAAKDSRHGVGIVDEAKTIVIDYSSPNVAKPMHVGHIRSTVIGDALTRVARLMGHRVISDNHLGDWGTQFGMIIYGYKHFVDEAAFQADPVAELTRLYRLVNQLIEYHEIKTRKLQETRDAVSRIEEEIAEIDALGDTGDKKTNKKNAKQRRSLETKRDELDKDLEALGSKMARLEASPTRRQTASEHAGIGDAVLEETAKLHAGDEENNALWERFLPSCKEEIQQIYERLDIEFDFAYGESHYHDQLPGVVKEMQERGLAVESDGAQCIFLDGFDAPMIVQKKDGAFLYATSDLATIRFRVETWRPDVILYVVDQRQHDHFAKLFAAARLWGYDEVDLRHVSFGTVLGPDGKPIKTREGDLVELGELLDKAVAEAYLIVQEASSELGDEEKREVARMVGHGAVKYNDLSHNRTSDYKFDLKKMVDLKGDTAPYIQYSYARCYGIFRRAGVNPDDVREHEVIFQEPIERALALELCRLESALEDVLVDYRPNLLTAYLYKLADLFAKFFEQCPVLKAESESVKDSRLLLCDLTARVLKTGLELLGIGVRQRM